MASPSLTLLLLMACSSEAVGSDAIKYVYGATASLALGRLQRARYNDNVDSGRLKRLQRLAEKRGTDADSAAPKYRYAAGAA